jgi:hypothetical protein
VAEVIDTLEIDLTVKPDSKSMAAAAKSLKDLQAASDRLAKASDNLTDEQRRVRDQMAATKGETAKLVQQEKALLAEVKRLGVPTREQAAALDKVQQSMAANRMAAKSYQAQLKALEAQQIRNARASRSMGMQSRDLRSNLGAARGTASTQAAASTSNRAEIGASAKEVGAAGLEAGAMMAKGAVGGTVALGAAVLKTSADFEKLRTQLRNIEGDEASAARAFAHIQDFAKKTPFQLEEVTEAFVKLKTRGVDPTEPVLTALGDVASTFGGSLGDITDAISAASRGELDPLEKYLSGAKTVNGKLQLSFRGTTVEVEKSAAAVTAAMVNFGQMEGVAGAMNAQSQTLYGMLSNLQDAVAQFLDAIGQAGVLEEFKALITDISNVAGGEQGLVKILAAGLVNAIKSLREIVQGLTAEDIKGWFMAAHEAMTNVADGIRILWKVFSALVDLSGGVGGALKVITLGVIALKTALMGPVGLVVAAGAAGMAIGQMLNAMGASDALADLLGDITGLNDELDRLGKTTNKRGAPELLGGGNITPELTEDQKLDAELKSRADDRIASAAHIKNIQADQARRREFGLDPDAKARAEKTAFDARAKRRKKGGKGKKETDASLAHEIDEQLKSTAREMARRDTARALQQGKITNAEMRDYEKNSYETRLARTRERFAETHELPAGIASDLAQIRRLPNEEDLVGRTQAPVISITNKITNIRDNEFVMQVTGTFAGTAEALATEALGSFRRKIEIELGGAYPDYVGPERL